MSILNVYQLLFLFAFGATIAASLWAKRSARSVPAGAGTSVASVTAGITDSVKERIRALDGLLDQHLLTVDEYVEQRNRITRGPIA